jgi:glutathione S-transferase
MAGGPAVRLYRAEWSTNCERVGLALAHKGIEAQSVLIDYANRRPVEAISGQGLVPAIEDAGQVIHDSVAILRHVDERTPQPPLWPADAELRSEVDGFIDWFETEYKRPPNAIEAELGRDDPNEDLIGSLAAEMTANLASIEARLDSRPHLFGELGAADFVAYPFLKYGVRRDPADTELFHVILDDYQQLGDDHPRLRAWVERMAGLPCAY